MGILLFFVALVLAIFLGVVSLPFSLFIITVQSIKKAKAKSKFGNPDETISSVIGKNKRANALTKTGRALSFLLDWVDSNHSLKSIEDDE